MESKFKKYIPEEGLYRIREILNASNYNENAPEIPTRNQLTFDNGFYIENICSLFVDIRSSSQLPKQYQKRVLARIYRSYISEVVAILNSNLHCQEINIVGDCVSAVFNGQTIDRCSSVFYTSGQINSIVHLLNEELAPKYNNYVPIKIGIGIAYGQILMVKAGYKGSGINEVVWMGDVVNEASNLCNQANKNGNATILLSNSFFERLKPEYQNKCKSLSFFSSNDFRQANYRNSDIDNL